ncbi:MAG: type II secretion system protein [Verrucomicrobiae bacterium]|nr:type II secretion system protein [Verrucomicrobiae bacterium]
MRLPYNDCRERYAFTLIELIVVCGLFCLLLALLMPSLKIVRERGKQIQCMSNLRQCHLATMQYVGDNDDILPINHNNPSTEPPVVPWSVVLVNKTYLKGNVHGCPSMKIASAWRGYASYIRYSYYPYSSEPERWGGGWNCSNIPFLMDSYDSSSGLQIWSGFSLSATSCIHCRHNKLANVCFLDGHIGAMAKGDFFEGPYNTRRWGHFDPLYILER